MGISTVAVYADGDAGAPFVRDADAGLFYICTPNNPTGTTTPLDDVKWLLANKAKHSVVVVDEAYIRNNFV